MNVTVKIIPHSQHRYPTCGDWVFLSDEFLIIYVSNMNNWKYEMLVALHEQQEAILCKARGISQKEVDEFDMKYEKDRGLGLHSDDSEPGGDKRAPYFKEHYFATICERMLAAELDIDWSKYENAINDLFDVLPDTNS